MSERREAIFVNKLVRVHPLSIECQICNISHGLYECNICKRNICINHQKKIKNNPYCSICINDSELTIYLNAIEMDKNKKSCYTNFKESLKYIFSFEWIHRK
jgi:hypothetical protein